MSCWGISPFISNKDFLVRGYFTTANIVNLYNNFVFLMLPTGNPRISKMTCASLRDFACNWLMGETLSSNQADNLSNNIEVYMGKVKVKIEPPSGLGFA